MKNLILSIAVLSLTGCVVAPRPYVGNDVVAYPPVQVAPSVEIMYLWDPIQFRYYHVDRYNSRHYMPHGWQHPRGYRPPGHDHWDRR
jgi:hypothetical protein